MATHTSPPRTIKVTRAHVYAARTRAHLDRQSGLQSPAWIVRLAAVDLHIPSGRRASSRTAVAARG